MKTLEICSLSHSSKISSSFLFKLILMDLLISDNNLIFSFNNFTKLFLFKVGFGILAKSENSFTKFSICFIWEFIIFKFSLNDCWSSLVICPEYLVLIRSIVNCIGVRGFLISWANFLDRFPHALYLSFTINFSCWFFSLLIIELKFLFNTSISLSVLISGTFVFKFPWPISVDARIRLLIDLKNLDENLIAIVIEINNSNETIII